MAWYETLLMVYLVVIHVISFGFLLSWVCEQPILLYTPKEIYEATGMNWFGSILLWIGQVLLNPIAWIGMFIVMGLYWLFTVGRRD